MLFVNANVIDVLTDEKMRHRTVFVGADGRTGEMAAGPPVGRPDSEVVDLAGRWPLAGLISCHTRADLALRRPVRDAA